MYLSKFVFVPYRHADENVINVIGFDVKKLEWLHANVERDTVLPANRRGFTATSIGEKTFVYGGRDTMTKDIYDDLLQLTVDVDSWETVGFFLR